MPYVKALLAVLVAAVSALAVALGAGNNDGIGDLSFKSWLVAALAVVGSGGVVWLCENGPWAPAIKAVMAFLSAGIGSLVVALDDNAISQGEWLVAFAAAVTATGFVYQARDNKARELTTYDEQFKPGGVVPPAGARAR